MAGSPSSTSTAFAVMASNPSAFLELRRDATMIRLRINKSTSSRHRSDCREEVPMSRQAQINLLKRMLHYVDTRTTAMADSPWCNEVSAYTDPGRLADEQRVLFRQ